MTLLDERIVAGPIVFAPGVLDATPGEILPAPFDAGVLHRFEARFEIGRCRVESRVDAERRIGEKGRRRDRWRQREGEAVARGLDRRSSQRDAKQQVHYLAMASGSGNGSVSTCARLRRSLS